MTHATRRSRLLLATATLLALAVPAVPATGAVPIPPGPLDSTVPQFEGRAATPDPVRSRRVPQHPFLAAEGRNSMHNDGYATDAYAGPGPLGRDLELTSATYGVEECATMAFDRLGRAEALCGGLEGSRLMLLDPETLDVLAAHPLPPRRVDPQTSPLEDICAGAYFYLDHRDRAVIATTNAQIWVVGQTETPAGTGFELLRRHDLAAHVPEDDCLVALLPDWDGLIWFVTQEGGVGTVHPRTGRVRSMRLRGERIVNSFATDETGGVFIVSDHAMYRFDSGRRGRPRVTWRETYDRGSTQKPGQLSQGSGTTPTLVGRDLVVITDNADPRMRVVYELAGEFDVPVMIHTGDTYDPRGRIKYSHPIEVDEIAVDFPDVTFVICHLGNPWVTDAMEVIYKNENVVGDISGFTLGQFDERFEQYMLQAVKQVLTFAGDPSSLLYGTDWPICQMSSYLRFVRNLGLTEEETELVLWKNTARIFKLDPSSFACRVPDPDDGDGGARG